MTRISFYVLPAMLAFAAPGASEDSDRQDGRAAEAVLAQLTTAEKIKLVSGDFKSGGVERLGIDPILFADGPVGVRLNFPTDAARATAMPATIALAATWDREMAARYSGVLAEEMQALDRHVLFGPGLNLMRDPRGGRNFEYMGEDPFLTAELGVAYINGLQARGIGATAKHYAANESERFRHYTDSVVDPRTLHQIYLYPFLRAADAGVWTIMTSNNPINGRHMGENRPLVRSLLRDRLGWDGVVLTDWRSAYRIEESAPAGIDMTLGLSSYVYGDHMGDYVASGAWSERDLNQQVSHILKLYARVGLIGSRTHGKGAIATPAHAQVARETVRASATLLKNSSNLLPYTQAGAITLIGPAADAVMFGSGSGKVNDGAGNASLRTGLIEQLGEGRVTDAATGNEGLVIYAVKGVEQHEDADQDSILLDETQVEEILRLASMTDKLVLVVQSGTAIDLSPVADAADAILMTWFGGQEYGRGVADVLLGKAEPGGRLPITLAPLERYPAATMGTWPAVLTADAHPGGTGKAVPREPRLRFPTIAYEAQYDEGEFIGYRWFDRQNIEATYPFGFGMGYTTFSLGTPRVTHTATGVRIEAPLTNTGERAGSTVLQVYAEHPASMTSVPVRELRGFTKVGAAPGATARAAVDIPWQRLTRYDPASAKWIVQAGTHRLRLGFSSRQLEQTVEVVLDQTMRFDAP